MSTSKTQDEMVAAGLQTSQLEPQVPDLLDDTAKVLGCYALNLAYGAVLEPWELTHLKKLAAAVKAKVFDRNQAFASTKRILGEVQKERRRQVELFGFTPEHDAQHRDQLREQILNRVYQAPNVVDQRQELIEAAAMIVAEVEMLDASHAQPQEASPPEQPSPSGLEGVAGYPSQPVEPGPTQA